MAGSRNYPPLATPVIIFAGLFSLLVSLASMPAWAIDVTEETILREQWPEYVNGASISALPQTRNVLSRFDENGKMQITIRYPGGAQGIAWGRQLMEWFVAFGVPGKYLRMELGSGGADRLVIQLVDRTR